MLSQSAENLLRDQNGIVQVETLLVVPLLTFGIFELGNMMWQRQQLQVGVRDGARHQRRCRSVTGWRRWVLRSQWFDVDDGHA